MVSSYPRTKTILVNGLETFQKEMGKHPTDPIEAARVAVEAAHRMFASVSKNVIDAFELVLEEKAVLNPALREQVYLWASSFPGTTFAARMNESAMNELLQQKLNKGLL